MVVVSEFEYVPEYPEKFVLWFYTNNGAFGGISESSWKFLKEDGNIFLASGALAPNAQLKDTLTFSPGCYTFLVEDTDEDGLDFWANNDGNGIVRFREDNGGPILKAFDPDFGTNIIHQFTIGGNQNTSQKTNTSWKIFPNPAKNNLIIEGFSGTKSEILIIDNLGKKVIKTTTKSSGFISETIDLKKLEHGIYFVKISNEKSQITKKVVKQ